MFDKEGRGEIYSKDLIKYFNSLAHPAVRNRQMSEQQAFLEFISFFSDYKNDGSIAREEWNDYYASVSASIEVDDHFAQLIKMQWKLD